MAAGDDISERLLVFGATSVRVARLLPNDPVSRHIALQLVKAATSSGANYEEARGAESRADFIHKLGVALKEMRESRFWLRIIPLAFNPPPEGLVPLLEESGESGAILGKSVITAKQRGKIPFRH
jgi:four helix bundle protein